jgi:son of sevenless-like protein
MEVIAGLQAAPTSRLRKTWGAVPKDKMKLFDELTDLLSPVGNYTNLRNHLHREISPPIIPYIGVYLTDLTFLEDGNPDMAENGTLINFDKRRRIATVINEIKVW